MSNKKRIHEQIIRNIDALFAGRRGEIKLFYATRVHKFHVLVESPGYSLATNIWKTRAFQKNPTKHMCFRKESQNPLQKFDKFCTCEFHEQLSVSSHRQATWDTPQRNKSSSKISSNLYIFYREGQNRKAIFIEKDLNPSSTWNLVAKNTFYVFFKIRRTELNSSKFQWFRFTRLHQNLAA